MTWTIAAAVFCFADMDGDANAIMQRMAANLDTSLEERRQYVYKQKVNARLTQSNGKPVRSEKREYRATPGPERTEKTLLSLAGEYHPKGKKEPVRYTKEEDEGVDSELLQNLIDDLVNDKRSRDGIPHSLFPLSQRSLKGYKFRYLGSTEVKGRKAHRIGFEPVNKKELCLHLGGDDAKDNDDCESAPWKGEAVVDAEEYQPVRIFSDLTFKMPWAVKVFLGTNLRQTGFSVSYERVAPNVWFPSTYGTEFEVDVLFFYKRVITMAMDSSEFQRTEAKSEIKFQTAEVIP